MWVAQLWCEINILQSALNNMKLLVNLVLLERRAEVTAKIWLSWEENSSFGFMALVFEVFICGLKHLNEYAAKCPHIDLMIIVLLFFQQLRRPIPQCHDVIVRELALPHRSLLLRLLKPVQTLWYIFLAILTLNFYFLPRRAKVAQFSNRSLRFVIW